IVWRQGDKTGRQLDHVKTKFLALAKVSLDRRSAFARQDMFDEAAGGDIRIMPMCEVVELPDAGTRHQCERAAGKFDAVDILAYRLQNVGEIPYSHDRIVGAADFRQPTLTRLGCPSIEPDEWKSSLVQIRLACGGRPSRKRQLLRIVPPSKACG